MTVLGKYSPFPPSYGACSGYLIRVGEDYILLDCGNGILSRMQEFIEIKDLSALLLTHHHPDHKADINVLRHAWEALLRQDEVNNPLPLYTVDSPWREYRALKKRRAYKVIKLRSGLDYPFNKALMEWIQTNHPMKCAAFAINYKGKKLVFTGDTELTAKSELYKFCRNADLLLCESSLLEEEKGLVPGHMTPGEAAHLASESGVKRLLLTHFWPFYDEDKILEQGKDVFNNTEVAKERETYKV